MAPRGNRRLTVNYRHAFHAGGFADCVKHALLVWLMDSLLTKPAPIFVLDTHAGAGQYDLDAAPARRTGAWRKGIALLLDAPPRPLGRYVGLVKELGLYPGSPALIGAMLRPGDRLACCELHPEEVADLRRRFAGKTQIAVHFRDGWEALGGLLPPKERRGLVLIDPPFESPDEFADMAAGLAKGCARFPTGVFAAWYPIKHRAPVRSFRVALHESGIPDIVAAELCLRRPLDADRLNGCGLAVINPPFRFEDDVPLILEALLQRLGANEDGSAIAVSRLADE